MNQGTAEGRVLQAQGTARVKAGSKSEPGESEEFKAARVTGRQSGAAALASWTCILDLPRLLLFAPRDLGSLERVGLEQVPEVTVTAGLRNCPVSCRGSAGELWEGAGVYTGWSSRGQPTCEGRLTASVSHDMVSRGADTDELSPLQETLPTRCPGPLPPPASVSLLSRPLPHNLLSLRAFGLYP